RMRSTLATEVPPNFITTTAIAIPPCGSFLFAVLWIGLLVAPDTQGATVGWHKLPGVNRNPAIAAFS
ncbi:hypothetical protein MXD81_09130, partial [Microbacteriaceae bacterium K1510]|nr:hypothetical protein [Microbacteriaceae bacterium K1510]